MKKGFREYITKALNGMALGLFASLIIGLILKQIGDFTGIGYELANIVIFVIIQPGLIILFYVLWRKEKKKNKL